MANDWSSVFGILFLLMVGGSIWGAVVLAMKWASGIVPRILLGFALCAVFVVAATTACIAGCAALSGPMHFQ